MRLKSPDELRSGGHVPHSLVSPYLFSKCGIENTKPPWYIERRPNADNLPKCALDMHAKRKRERSHHHQRTLAHRRLPDSVNPS